MTLLDIIAAIPQKPYYIDGDKTDPNGVIYCADCLEVLPHIPAKNIDMILCDLPYGTTACDWDIIIPFEPLWKQYKRIIKDNGAIVLMASQPFTSMLIMSNIKMFKYEWIWNKIIGSNPYITKYQPMRIHENICIFYSYQCTYNPIKTKRQLKDLRPNSTGEKAIIKEYNNTVYGNRKNGFAKDYNNTIVGPKSIIEIIKHPNSIGLHPTQKSIELFEYLVKTYTNENEIVLDNCIGSGTTAVACKQLSRKFIGIEISEKYCEIAKQRLQSTPESLFKE